MKKIYTAALLAALGLTGAANVQAAGYTGHLIVGFTAASGNDLIYDLGNTSALTDGETWSSLTTLLLGSGYDLSTVKWGVIGDKNVTGTYTSWSTASPNPVPNDATWNNIDIAVSSIYQNFSSATAGTSLSIAYTDANSWNTQTVSPTLTTQYANVYGNPNFMGGTTATLFQAVSDGSTPAPLGTFSFDSGTGVLTFNAAPVPEPGTMSLVGGGALLLLAFRNKFRRPQA